MRKILIILTTIIIVSFLSILGISINKEKSYTEHSYSLRCNYNFLYDEDIKMKIYLYSNKKDPMFIDTARNTYYLTNYEEDYNMEVKFNEINVVKEKEYYRFELETKIPNVSKLYIENLYLLASNEYYTDKFDIGSLDILEDNYLSEIEYKKLEISNEENYLDEIKLTLDNLSVVEEIIICEEFEYVYRILDDGLRLDIESNNLTYELFAVIKTGNGLIKIKNIIINNNEFLYENNEYFISVGIRSSF